MTLEGTNTYIVGRPDMRGAIVIDPGPADAGHAEAVKEAAAERGGIGSVLLTHGHGDHAAGVELLGVEPTNLTDGESNGALTAVATPGHAPDHIVFVADKACFCGDLIAGQGSSIVPSAEHGGSLTDYMASLWRLLDLELEVLYPGHGPRIDDPAAKIEEYIEHRRDRDAKLLKALEDGERSRAKLLDAAWDDVPAELRGAAAIAMQAHLEKLELEGRLPDDLTD